MLRHETVVGPLLAVHEAKVRGRQLHRTLDHRLEERLQIKDGAAHRSEDLCHGGLLLERLLRLVEQTDVLEGNDGLVRERLDESYLVCGEGPDLGAPKGDHPDRCALSEERDREVGAETPARCLLPGLVLRVG